tara:strand:+ start:12856 stop:12996 length:141 start_codon:yes stop_codon:yes gene_type:complete
MMKKLTMESLLDIEAVYFETLSQPSVLSKAGKKVSEHYADYLSESQ